MKTVTKITVDGKVVPLIAPERHQELLPRLETLKVRDLEKELLSASGRQWPPGNAAAEDIPWVEGGAAALLREIELWGCALGPEVFHNRDGRMVRYTQALLAICEDLGLKPPCVVESTHDCLVHGDRGPCETSDYMRSDIARDRRTLREMAMQDYGRQSFEGDDIPEIDPGATIIEGAASGFSTPVAEPRASTPTVRDQYVDDLLRRAQNEPPEPRVDIDADDPWAAFIGREVAIGIINREVIGTETILDEGRLVDLDAAGISLQVDERVRVFPRVKVDFIELDVDDYLKVRRPGPRYVRGDDYDRVQRKREDAELAARMRMQDGSDANLGIIDLEEIQ